MFCIVLNSNLLSELNLPVSYRYTSFFLLFESGIGKWYVKVVCRGLIVLCNGGVRIGIGKWYEKVVCRGLIVLCSGGVRMVDQEIFGVFKCPKAGFSLIKMYKSSPKRTTPSFLKSRVLAFFRSFRPTWGRHGGGSSLL